MNDLDEVRFGLLHGSRIVRANVQLQSSLHSEERAKLFYASFDRESNFFQRTHLLDTYVFCLSEHEQATPTAFSRCGGATVEMVAARQLCSTPQSSLRSTTARW